MRSEAKKPASPWITLLKGVAVSVAASLAGIVAFAFVLKAFSISEGAIPVTNQLIKALSIILGTWIAVGRGGEKGILKGGAVGLVYSLLGMLTYSLAGGEQGAWQALLGDTALAMAIGAVAGILAANTGPGKQRSSGPGTR